MSDRAMARAEFFKYVAAKTVSLIGDAAEGFVKPLSEATGKATGIVSKPLLPVSEYDGNVKLLTSTKPPLFLVGEIDSNLVAISALCEEDSFLFSYQPQDDSFYCAVCGSKHDLVRTGEEIKTDLATTPLFVKEGQICMLSKS